MKWIETEASDCRYGDVAGTIWCNWDILWEDSDVGYQGHASFLAEKDGEYCFYEWWYGSCSGCDSWEAAEFTTKAIRDEMVDTALWLEDKDALLRWLAMLESNVPISHHGDGGMAGSIDRLSGGLRERILALRELFADDLKGMKVKGI